MSIVNPVYFEAAKIAELKAQFNSAQPFPFIVMENFLLEDAAHALYENFPKIDTLKVKRKSINEDKAEEYHLERFHPSFKEVRPTLEDSKLISMLEEISGIKGLITVDDSLGCGVHQGKNGSFVDVHIDINVHPGKSLHRRINLLIYLNKNWQDSYGGHLELWDKEMKKCHHEVAPNFNRAIMFLTDDNSPHGYNKINVPEEETRKSVYCYYYTPLGKDVKYRDSRFISRPTEGSAKRFITEIKETLKINLKKALKLAGIKSLDFDDKN
jgi:Rps23 Pro-64 3,4-dihydroxylase Tpa1-like proline 4-hydroxylase